MSLDSTQSYSNVRSTGDGFKATIVPSEGEVGRMYESGWLPAFLPAAKEGRLFYRAPQSLRVDLSKFELSSENRRVLKKADQFEHEIALKEDFAYDPITVGKFCKDYFDEKFGTGVMSVSRIKRIFSAPMTTHVWKYHRGGERVGYVTCFINDELFNYTFAFYDLKYYKENLGIRMMLDAVIWVKENGKKYIYLGSVRDASGLYKTQFKGWEFWDGERWSGDKEQLKNSAGVE